MDSRQRSPLSQRRSGAGLSLVELLVATLVTLIGLLVITQVFTVYEGWKRTTTGVAQTQEAGLLGAFAIEQDLRNAGFGMVGLECATISGYNAKATPSNAIELSGSPVTISNDDPDKGTDSISILYSSSPFANIAAKVQAAMVTSASDLYVDNGLGFAVGDMLLLAQDSSACAILQVSAEPKKEGQNVTSPGSSWILPHAPGSSAPWNPPTGNDILPAPLSIGAQVLSLGQLVDHRFYVADNTLRLAERSADDGSVTVYDLIPGVMALRAECLPGACNAQPTAIRFGLIVRSGNREKDVIDQREVSVAAGKATIAFWPGDESPAFDLDEEMRHYRYRVFNTVVPLKNTIWNK